MCGPHHKGAATWPRQGQHTKREGVWRRDKKTCFKQIYHLMLLSVTDMELRHCLNSSDGPNQDRWREVGGSAPIRVREIWVFSFLGGRLCCLGCVASAK
jgi:hypothetical protein